MIEGKCEVCKEGISKYKCPVCVINFCCVACFKLHKANEQCVKPVNEKQSQDVDKKQNSVEVPEYEFETEDTVQPEKLQFLGKDKKLLKTLQNPHLRDMIKYLDSTKAPAPDMEQAMKEPIFVEFVEHCLRVVEGPDVSDSSSDDDSS